MKLVKEDYFKILHKLPQLDSEDNISVILIKVVESKNYEKFAKTASAINLSWISFGKIQTGIDAVNCAYKEILTEIERFITKKKKFGV
jgi:hypothetical protein